MVCAKCAKCAKCVQNLRISPKEVHTCLGRSGRNQPEKLASPALLEFAGIPPATVLCYPLTSQIAEKLHAYTRPYAGGESSRVRDFVDILLIASLANLSSQKLSEAIKITFEVRATHDVPKELPKPPASWAAPYNRLARELNLTWQTIDDAWQAATYFLHPVLDGTSKAIWDPASWSWSGFQ